MNVRIFWVRAMKCMCAQTRPQSILSSERVFWGMEFEAMLTPREKIPCTGKFPQRRIEPATLWTVSPTTTNELFRPLHTVFNRTWANVCSKNICYCHEWQKVCSNLKKNKTPLQIQLKEKISFLCLNEWLFTECLNESALIKKGCFKAGSITKEIKSRFYTTFLYVWKCIGMHEMV